MNTLKTKSIPSFKTDYLDGENLNPPEAKRYDLLSDFTIIENVPVIFLFMTCKRAYMHHIEYKYSTLDNSFDKNAPGLDTFYADIKPVSADAFKRQLTKDEQKYNNKKIDRALILRSAYAKNKISAFFIIYPFSPDDLVDREDRRKGVVNHSNSYGFELNPRKKFPK